MADLVLLAQRAVPGIPLEMVSQGAEALVFSSKTHPYLRKPGTYICKYRPSKRYRHPQIDAMLTKQRTIGEFKFMAKLGKLGLRAPKVVALDVKNGVIWMEHVGYTLPNGSVSSLKNYLWSVEDRTGDEVRRKLTETGQLIGKMHSFDMIHGDLTSSNLMLTNNSVCLIDFGLSLYSALPEDKAVDLYVLERAIVSTHSEHSQQYTEWLLEGYKSALKKKSTDTLRKLDDVRLRGRKRSMLG